METAYELAKKHLNYVYPGNIGLPEKSNTVCPDCGKTLLKRKGFRVTTNLLVNGQCSRCGGIILGKF